MKAIKKILLVDDDEDDREFFLAAIHDLDPGLECMTAANGKDAFQLLVTNADRPEVIFLDLNMPIMNGKQFLQERKKHNDLMAIPVVVLTTSSDVFAKSETTVLGANDFVTKPDKHSLWKLVLRNTFNDLVQR